SRACARRLSLSLGRACSSERKKRTGRSVHARRRAEGRCRSGIFEVARHLRRGDRQIPETRFQRREDSVFTFSRILSGRFSREDVSRERARIRTSTAGRSLERGRSFQKEVTIRAANCHPERSEGSLISSLITLSTLCDLCFGCEIPRSARNDQVSGLFFFCRSVKNRRDQNRAAKISFHWHLRHGHGLGRD